MDEEITKTDKTKEGEINVKKLIQEDKENSLAADETMFNETLAEIDQILSSLEEKSKREEPQLEKSETLHEKKITNSNDKILDDYKIEEPVEHKIDQNLLPLEELEHLKKIDEKKFFFGFYSYLILIITIFFTTYFTLNVSKDLISLKYPFLKPHIDYFFEITEILEVTIRNLLSQLKILLK